ncbi:MAG TPA: ABC transporter permease, partial [Ktedonobacterales bacterium]|nr:ABC transporter permease [Ktedonobacterales bacterium]
MQQMIAFIANPQNQFRAETLATLRLSIVPIILALIVGIPLGIGLAQRPLAAFIAANTSGLVRAIPTLAVLAAVVPYLGVGFKPSVFALSLLGVPPILLNTITGLRSIDPATVEAARGMGMTRWQILSRVQIPLMAPVLAAGVRTSAVQIVASVPLAALIGGAGYGDYILAGINLLQNTPLFVGGIGIALLAFFTEILLGQAQRALTPAGLKIATVSEQAAEGAANEPPDATGSA